MDFYQSITRRLTSWIMEINYRGYILCQRLWRTEHGAEETTIGEDQFFVRPGKGTTDVIYDNLYSLCLKMA